jgi:hypothetical protein
MRGGEMLRGLYPFGIENRTLHSGSCTPTDGASLLVGTRVNARVLFLRGIRLDTRNVERQRHAGMYVEDGAFGYERICEIPLYDRLVL